MKTRGMIWHERLYQQECHESERGDDQEHENQDRENVRDEKVNLVLDDDDTAQSKNCNQQVRKEGRLYQYASDVVAGRAKDRAGRQCCIIALSYPSRDP